MPNPMTQKLMKSLVVILGVLVLAIMLLIFARDTSRIGNWSSSGFVLSSIQPVDSIHIAFFGVDRDDFVRRPLPANGDTLVAIADSAASVDRWAKVLESPHPPGREATIVYLHQGQQDTTTIKTRPVQRSLFYIVTVQQGIRLLIFFSFLVLGYWAFLKKSDSAAVRVLTLYCLAVASFMGRIYMPMYREMASFQVPLENILISFLNIFSATFSSFWLLLNMLFPRPAKIMRDHSWLAYILCFLPQTVLIIVSFLPGTDGAGFGIVVNSVFTLQILGGLYFLRHNFRHAETNLEKRQTKIVFWGSGVGLLFFILFAFVQGRILPISQPANLIPRIVVNNLLFLVLLASPLSFTYAFRRYRLLEVEARLRRGTRYLLVLVFMLAVLFGLVYLVGVVLLDSLGVASRTSTLLVALVLALGFAPAQKNLQQQVEKRFFPERKKLRRMTAEFLQSASRLPDCDSVCGELVSKLQESLQIKSVYVILRARQNNGFAAVAGQQVPVAEQGELVNYLRKQEHPLFLDEAFASARIQFSLAEQQWLEVNNVALILPLRAHGEALGFLALGHKLDREDYHPEELQILAGLADQVTLTIINLRLLEENLEKRRMEEELLIARRVQLRFLPQELPATPGLEITAKSTFSQEVAGDYYDVIPLKDGRTVLAVGDVSGKGTGAALIMANLQASLRAFCGVDLRLEDLVARINEMIFTNTEGDQFITFFVGIFDPAQKSLTYVNAGHNPPLLVRVAGEVEALSTGGLILGAFPSLDYQQETAFLSSGDLLFIYTDGLSEAMNGAEEEFGEERIRQALLNNPSASSQGIMDIIISQVERFRGETAPADDVTLLVARVT